LYGYHEKELKIRSRGEASAKIFNLKEKLEGENELTRKIASACKSLDGRTGRTREKQN